MIGQGQTIVAVSSPPGRSARGMVRISGDRVVAILGELLAPPKGAIDQVRAWPVAGRVVPWALKLQGEPGASGGPGEPGGPGSAGTLELPAQVGYFHGPKSYTGQDVAEIQVPGNPVLLQRLVARVLQLGARVAEPGEFTFRAFLAGKLDLTQAEGVAATIEARSAGQLRAAAALAGGELRGFAESIVEQLSDALALVEAGIDFVDQQDVVPIGPAALDKRLAKVEQALTDLVSRTRSWGAIEAIPRVVLVGRPSVGKSTLFNALLGQRRAVVDPIPGTTRDVLEESLELTDHNGRAVEVMLVDLAGLDQLATALDRQVQQVTRRTIDKADVLVMVDDRNPPSLPPSPTASGQAPAAKIMRVRTKVDLNTGQRLDGDWDASVSAKTGHGLQQLRQMIVQAVGDRGVSVGGQMMALQPRHESAIREALDAIRRARGLLESQQQQRALQCVELVAAAIREGLDPMAGLGGQMSPDDVLGKVFSTFCVGK